MKEPIHYLRGSSSDGGPRAQHAASAHPSRHQRRSQLSLLMTRGHPHFLGTGEWVAPSNPSGSISRWPVWASAPERASDTTGSSRLARGPRLPARLCLQVPLDCGQGRRAGSWCLGPRSVRTTLVMGGFPVRRGPFGPFNERNGRKPGSACRWPQVFHTQGIRLRRMTLFKGVFHNLALKGVN